jgi:putative transcriptional regulator
MNMAKKYQSEQLMVIHETATALFEIGAIDEAVMREFDRDCLVPKAPPATFKRDRVKAKTAYAKSKRRAQTHNP